MLSFYSYATEELINLFVNYSILSFFFFYEINFYSQGVFFCCKHCKTSVIKWFSTKIGRSESLASKGFQTGLS